MRSELKLGPTMIYGVRRNELTASMLANAASPAIAPPADGGKVVKFTIPTATKTPVARPTAVKIKITFVKADTTSLQKFDLTETALSIV